MGQMQRRKRLEREKAGMARNKVTRMSWVRMQEAFARFRDALHKVRRALPTTPQSVGQIVHAIPFGTTIDPQAIRDIFDEANASIRAAVGKES